MSPQVWHSCELVVVRQGVVCIVPHSLFIITLIQPHKVLVLIWIHVHRLVLPPRCTFTAFLNIEVTSFGVLGTDPWQNIISIVNPVSNGEVNAREIVHLAIMKTAEFVYHEFDSRLVICCGFLFDAQNFEPAF